MMYFVIDAYAEKVFLQWEAIVLFLLFCMFGDIGLKFLKPIHLCMVMLYVRHVYQEE